MTNLTYPELKAIMRKLGYVWFGNRPYDMNVIGIRKNNPIAGKFDDWMYWCYIDTDGVERTFGLPITTDPGLYYLQNPMNPKGTAILKPGQWLGMWGRGMHKGYQALVQIKPVTVIRDFNRDGVLDYDSGREETGIFGINLHYGGSEASAGCQVMRKIHDLQYCLSLNFAQKQSVGTYTTSYTLLLEQWL